MYPVTFHWLSRELISWYKSKYILRIKIIIFKNYLLFGYKISDNNYYGVNYFITILRFSIYKSYYLSEQKTTNVNVYNFFIYELNKRTDDI
jgi:hypothetical protein